MRYIYILLSAILLCMGIPPLSRAQERYYCDVAQIEDSVAAFARRLDNSTPILDSVFRLWDDSLYVFRSATFEGVHWKDTYIASDCFGNVYRLGGGDTNGFSAFLRRRDPSLLDSAIAMSLMRFHFRYIVSPNTDSIAIIERGNIAAYRYMFPCIDVPILKENTHDLFKYGYTINYYVVMGSTSKRMFLQSFSVTEDLQYSFASIEMIDQ